MMERFCILTVSMSVFWLRYCTTVLQYITSVEERGKEHVGSLCIFISFLPFILFLTTVYEPLIISE